MMAANKPPQYNPMMMQLAQQMMQAGQQRPMTYGRTDGLAAGLTSAGNSLVGAMMMKPQMKAYQEQQKGDALARVLMMHNMGIEVTPEMVTRMGLDPTEVKDVLQTTEQATEPTQAKKPKLGRSIAAAALGPLGGLVNPKQAAGAPSGQKAAPAAKGMPASPKLKSQINPQAQAMIGAMLSSPNPETQQQGMELLVKSIPAPLSPKDRLITVGGDKLFDVYTMQQIDLRPGMKSEYDLKGGKLIFDYSTGGYVFMPNVEKPELEVYDVVDPGMSQALEIEVKRPRLRDKNTKKDYGKYTDAEGNWPITDYNPMSQTGEAAFFGKTAVGEIEKQLIAGEANLAMFDLMDEALDDESYLTSPGKLRAKWIEVKDKHLSRLPGVGQYFPVSENEAEYLGDFTNFHTIAMHSLNAYIRAITGAQMSEIEADRIRQATADAQRQGPIAFRASLRAARAAVEAATRTYRRMKSEGLAANLSEEEAHIRAQAAGDQASFSAYQATYDSELQNLAKQDRGTKVPPVKVEGGGDKYAPPGMHWNELGVLVKD